MAALGNDVYLNSELLDLLPRVGWVAKVTVRSSLEVLGLLQVELLDNNTGPQVPVLLNDGNEFLVALLASAISVNVDRERLGNSNRVRKLDEDATSESSGNEGLGDPTSSVGSGPINLREVLAAEGTTTVSTPATIGVNNDLAASKASITLGATNDEAAGWLDVVDGVVVKEMGGITFLTIFAKSSERRSSVEMLSACWVEMTTVSTRRGMVAPPSFLYSIVT